MRELISLMTVSASGRLTEPLKWTVVGGMAVLSRWFSAPVCHITPATPRPADRITRRPDLALNLSKSLGLNHDRFSQPRPLGPGEWSATSRSRRALHEMPGE